LNSPLRERYKTIVEDLTAVLRRSPEHPEARFLRAQAFRRGGEYLAALDDLDYLARSNRKEARIVAERLLAFYQLYGLYLGSINDPLFRPHYRERIRDDLSALSDGGDKAQKHLAQMVDALARQDPAAAVLLIDALQSHSGSPERWPDLAMLEADALFKVAEEAHQAEEALQVEEQKTAARKQCDDLAKRALLVLRRGLDADPGHPGLLFLKANSFQRRSVLESGENDDRETSLRRHRHAFEATLNRLRNTTLRIGCDTAIAKAVLLANFDREDAALDQVKDALSCHPTVSHLQTWKAWLRLHNPPDGVLAADELAAIYADLEPIFETPPDDFSPYFVRGLLKTASGNWDDAQRDLRLCRRQLGADKLPTTNSGFSEWFNHGNEDSTTVYLDDSLEVLLTLSVPADLRIKLGESLLKRVSDSGVIEQEKLDKPTVRSIEGRTHFRLAKAYAGAENKEKTLFHAGEALARKVADVSPKSFRDDPSFSTWNNDPEFMKLYEKYESK
jgi:tetratricopeptide (TPR) repeat protein